MMIQNGKIAYHSYQIGGDASLWFVQYDFGGKELYRTKVREAHISPPEHT